MNEQVRPREGFQADAVEPPRQNGGDDPLTGFSSAEMPAINPALENAPPPKPVETWPIRVKLLHRIIRDNHGREVKEIEFRQPTGADINRCGNPCRINQDGDVVFDERKMSLIMANLSGILSPLLDQMDPRDWNSCAYRLRGFFLPDLAAW